MPLGSRCRCEKQRSRSFCRFIFQSLEPRQLLTASAATLLNSGYVPISENGHQVWVKQGQWLIEFASAASSKQIGKLNASVADLDGASTHSGPIVQDLGDQQTFLIRSSLDATMDDVRQSLAGVSGIQHIEPDYAIYAASVTPNDPNFFQQWGLQQTSDHDIDAPEAWELSTGSPSVVIAVPDTGIDYNHIDLSMNMWKNYKEIAGNGIDDDGNGLVDDVRGWDFVSNDNDPMDDQGHGTMVAGEMGATGNNSLGVSGVAWQVKLMPLKFIAYTGLGSSSGAILCINYAIKQKIAGVNVRAINASWVNNSYSQIFENTIVSLKNNDILFVAAAGNGGDDSVGDDNDAWPTYPASYWVPNVIAVAATDPNDELAGFSNYGALTVALAAPGVNILGTLPGNTLGASTGTSDAVPFVSGTIALAAAAVPNADYAMIRAALLAGVNPLPSLAGKTLSGGRLNARRTLEILNPHAAGDGLTATYYNEPDFSGTSISRIDPNVGFDWSSNAPLSGIDRNTYSVLWTGAVMPAATETYTFYTKADDGVRLWINGQPLVNRWSDRPLANDINADGIVNTNDFNILSSNFGAPKANFAMGDLNSDETVDAIDLNMLFASFGTSATALEDSGSITLTAGQKYAVRMEYYQNVGRAVAKLSWSSPTTPKQIIPQNRLFSSLAVPAGSASVLFPPVRSDSQDASGVVG